MSIVQCYRLKKRKEKEKRHLSIATVDNIFCLFVPVILNFTNIVSLYHQKKKTKILKIKNSLLPKVINLHK